VRFSRDMRRPPISLVAGTSARNGPGPSASICSRAHPSCLVSGKAGPRTACRDLLPRKVPPPLFARRSSATVALDVCKQATHRRRGLGLAQCSEQPSLSLQPRERPLPLVQPIGQAAEPCGRSRSLVPSMPIGPPACSELVSNWQGQATRSRGDRRNGVARAHRCTIR
jgi:hypothetical protein